MVSRNSPPYQPFSNWTLARHWWLPNQLNAIHHVTANERFPSVELQSGIMIPA